MFIQAYYLTSFEAKNSFFVNCLAPSSWVECLCCARGEVVNVTQHIHASRTKYKLAIYTVKHSPWLS